MDYSIKDILQRYSKAKSRKGIWDNRYEEVFSYTMPDRDNFYHNNNADKNETSGEDKRIGLYSSIGENSADAFVNRIQSILTPIASDWIGIEVNDQFEGAQEKNLELDKVSDLINGHKSASNFDTAITEFYYDLLAGTACLLITEGTLRNPLNFKAIPINELCIDEGIHGEVGYVYRKFTMRKELVKYQWAELNDMELTDDDVKADKDMELLECVMRNYKTNKYDYYVIDVENEKELVKREYNTNPFVVLRWSKCAGEVYGRGLGMKALHDIQTLNRITEYSLRALAFSLPIFLAQQDATFDPDDFMAEPGVLNVVPSTATANPSITTLPIQPTHDITAYATDVLKQEIKTSMLDSRLPADAGTPKSATEIAQRITDQNVNISSVFGRLLNEFLVPCTKRIIDVLQSFDYIDREGFDIDGIDGYGMRIKINTPLATQQSQGEVQNIINGMSLVTSFDPTGQVLKKTLKLSELIPYMLDNTGTPNRFVYTQEEVEENDKQAAKAQQEAMQAESEMRVKEATEIEMGKANAKQQAEGNV